ncbi:myosin light chain kinase, smooth muscle isoform X2 [Agrilus planipennis]|uniref:Myosin light chain kinase, smooth muscle isoform X2 n=1 Tax=Agrilus planipennis TaxID=224129 RepID=A0A1W4WP74_AGRPL|nr:myosin light chain kinase, smooth muscle isoform X2 [Agrilus planipennis]
MSKEVQLSFPYRDVQIKRGLDPKDFYDLEEEIGRGKFGTVYKCREKTSKLALAAKFVGCPKKEDRRNVEREVEIMRSLQHPRLLQIFDAFENGKTMCVILELIEGGELFERVIDENFILTEKACTVFMRQICEGIGYIHKQGILHLDMKPENILCLTQTGNRVKIIDFGLARKYDPSKKLQVLFGTPEFVAPEVVNFDDIGYGTDMWSVGVICYVLLSGLSPFMGATDVETMANVTIAKYDFDDDAFKDISENAKDFITKLLLKDIKSRMMSEDCLNHPWLKKKSPPKMPTNERKNITTTTKNNNTSMETTKENLKNFVERWNEHPNSPYVFEMTHQVIIPPISGLQQRSNSLHSLQVCSPSSCQSLTSSVASEDGFLDTSDSNSVEYLPDHLRRSSDSSFFVKGSDVAERANLADEIRKLTDKLFQLSSMPGITNGTNGTEEINIKEEEKNERNAIQKGRFTDKLFTESSTTHPSSGVPWRRQKFKINNLSRDVPLQPKYIASAKKIEAFYSNMNGSQQRSNTINLHEKCFEQYPLQNTNSVRCMTQKFEESNLECTANGTKDMLLKLLEQWDEGKTSHKPLLSRHGSIASEWLRRESVGQRTISSLNSFFQMRATTKTQNGHDGN